MIKIGYMEYANVYPIFHYLLQNDSYEFMKGFPADLNKAMREGRIDVSPSSSIEYCRNHELYSIVPDISISSTGAVKSVNIFSNLSPKELHGKKLYFTKESNTSTVLARIILERYYDIKPQYVNDEKDCDAKLLIGDKALYEYYNTSYKYTIDLGEQWYKFTKLPFVFALWIVSKKATMAAGFKDFAAELQSYAGRSSKHNEELVGRYVTQGYTKEQMIDYWQTIDYRLTDKHIEGLRLFYKYAFELGETKQNPDIEFCR